jgi:signal transduction histidine kinase
MLNRLLLILGILSAVSALTAGIVVIERDRGALLGAFGATRREEARELARQIAGDLKILDENLLLAGQLVRASDVPKDRERELSALVAAVAQYAVLSVQDATGEVLSIVDDSAPRFEFRAAMAAATHDALAAPEGTVVISPPLAADHVGWYRAAALHVPGSPLAIVVLVDTSVYFTRLKLAGPNTRVVLVGPGGEELPAGRPAGPVLAPVLAAMRSGETGSSTLGESDARALGLGPAEAVVAWEPIAMPGGPRWSIATISSAIALRDRDRALVVRLGLLFGGGAIFLVVFGIYGATAWRRAATVRERLQHANVLAHLHEKAQKIVDHVPAAVIVLGDDGRVTAVNQVVRDRLQDDPAGGVLAAVFPAAPLAVVERLAALLEEARRAEKTRSLVGEQLALFGTEGRYSVHAVPLAQHFPDARALLVVEDVSEVHSLASQLLRAEKLATVGVLAAGIAHEVGTPLGIVRARAELLAAKLDAGHPQAGGVQVIVEQIDRIVRTLRQLLDFARVRPSDTGAVRLGQTARAVVELLRFEAQRCKVSLEVLIDEDVPAVAANADELQQVLVNVVLNACDACEHATGARRVTIAAHAEPPGAGGWTPVRIDVADTGVGIPAADRDQIFDPFFTTKKRGKGTGLGLTIASQIVRNHGGRIDVESDEGRGTRVSIVWPAAPTGRGRDVAQA